MSISFHPYVFNDGVWQFPAGVSAALARELQPQYGTPEWQAWYDGEVDLPNPQYDMRLDVNCGDRNAKLVLNEMGLLDDIEDVSSGVPMTIDAFELAVNTTLARNSLPIAGLPEHRSGGNGQMTLVSFGVRDGYVNDILLRLQGLIAAAREHGAEFIGWG